MPCTLLTYLVKQHYFIIGFQLVGYDKPAILEVYIGTDQGREAPHMFYQACRVSGKNSTPCVEKNVNGTVLIEIEFDPAKEMTVM